jgi:hypothetical protein
MNLYPIIGRLVSKQAADGDLFIAAWMRGSVPIIALLALLAACGLADTAWAQAVASPEVAVDCEGTPWPAGYFPAPRLVEPPSTRLGPRALAPPPTHRLRPLDVQTLLIEDEENAANQPLRTGVDRTVDAPVAGVWTDASDGNRIWRAQVSAEGAIELRLHLADFHLPPGATLYVYPPDAPRQGHGPYSDHGPLGDGEFWAGTTSGESVVVEYCTADTQTAGVPFTIDKVGHMYRFVDNDGKDAPRSWYSCMQSVACYPAWLNVSYSVAKITFNSGGNWYNCSATLLATQNADNTPYLLTSAHCIDNTDEAGSIECRWFYQQASCGGGLMTSQYTYVSEVLGTSGASSGADWSLLMIRGLLPSGLYWSGWTTTNPANGSWADIVHHPGGGEKRYSRGITNSYSSYYNHITFNTPGSVGAIYYGTSGSSVFTESEQKVYGNASYTTDEPGCDFLGSAAGYGKFSSYYNTIASLLAAGGDDALEANDTCATAAGIGNGSWPNQVVKRYGAGGAQGEDWYLLTINGGGHLTVNLSFTDAYGDINAQLYDTCGGTVVASSTGTSNSETISYTNSGATAAFRLRVYLLDNTRNTYAMTVQGAFMDCNGNLKDDACDISCSAPGCSSVPGCGLSLDCNADNVPDDCQGGDPCPPTPNPPSWVTLPTPLSTTSITMQAYASDPAGVQYTFDATGNNSHDRGWDAAATYTDTGLDVNRNYTYRVKARDASAMLNETAYTPVADVATMIQTPTALSFGVVTPTSIPVTATGTFTRLTAAQSGLYFEVLDPGNNHVGGSQANAWVQVQSITATGLTPGTTYRFRVKARNYYGVNETAWYPSSGYISQITQANCTLLGDVNGDGAINGLDVGGFVRTKLGGTLLPGENAACAAYGGSLEQDIADFVADLLGN